MELKVHFPLNDSIASLPPSISTAQIADQFIKQLHKVPNRSTAFFDEIVQGYVILSHGTLPSSSAYYGKLVESLCKVSIELSCQPSDYTKGSKERVQLDLINVSNSSDLIYNGEMCGDEKMWASIWKFEIPVTYPKKKIAQPKIILSVLVNVQQGLIEENSKVSEADTEEKQDNGTKSRNLLEGIISQTFETAKVKPYLLESLITTKPVIPPAPKNEQEAVSGPLLLKAKFSLPVYPLLTMRLKSAKLAGHTNRNSVLATLELSSSKDVFKIDQLSVAVTKIELTLKDGEVTELFDRQLLQDLVFKTKNDNINLTFKLALRSNFDNDLLKPLNIKIVTVPRIGHNKNLTKKIEMKWRTNIDFELVANSKRRRQQQLPPSRSVSSQNLVNLQRKSDLRMSLKHQSTPQANNQQLQQQPSHQQLPQFSQNNSALNGIKVTVYGTNKVELGDIFQWSFQIINKTTRFTKLLVLLNNESYLSESILEKKFPKLPILSTANQQRAKSRSTVSLNSISRDPHSMIHSQMNLIRTYNLSKYKAPGIVAMSNEIRIDNLEPQSLVTLKIDIMAVQKGIHNLDGVKIVDLNSGETYECGKLLQVVVD